MLPPTIVSYQRARDALALQRESITRRAFDELTADSELEVPTSVSETEIYAQLSHILNVLEAENAPADVMIAPRDRLASLFQTYVARRSVEAGKTVELPSAGLEAKFDSKDLLGWAGSFFRWWKKLSPHEFVDWTGTIDRLGNQARVAVLGDWGSGLYGAPECAKSIEKDTRGIELVLHLGDIYYAGDDDEVRDRFLPHWPRIDGALNRALNGNHEMYTGGKAYFDIALESFSQPSSFWVGENDHWVLIGLDTAYKDHDLHGNQVQWIRQVLNRAAGRKVLLFSHHQPYSLFDTLRHKSTGLDLVSRVAPFLETRAIFGWYWGHEHHCIIYDDHPLWGLKGRCVGHSGFPEFRPKAELGAAPARTEFRVLQGRNLVPGGLVMDGPNVYIPGHETRYVPHGYLVLEFDDEHLVELYFEAGGELIRENRVS